MYRKQRVKLFWLQNGDQNTKFFHRFASAWRKNNGFQRIKNEDGEWTESEEDIQGVVTNYFSKLFKPSCLNGKLSDRDVVNQVIELENIKLGLK